MPGEGRRRVEAAVCVDEGGTGTELVCGGGEAGWRLQGEGVAGVVA